MTSKKDEHATKLGASAKKPTKSTTDADLNEALEESFPASDPPSMTQPATEIGSPHGKHRPAQKKR